jgi:hypothetical protein
MRHDAGSRGRRPTARSNRRIFVSAAAAAETPGKLQPVHQLAEASHEFETVLVIARAIQKFVAVYEASCREFNDFSDWAVAQGHLPKPIVEPKYPTAKKPTTAR